MKTVRFYPMHNTITFAGKRLSPKFAKLINDTMYELSGIDGLYKYEVSSSTTAFSIYPESYDFGDEPGELENSIRLYQEVYEYVIAEFPESIV